MFGGCIWADKKIAPPIMATTTHCQRMPILFIASLSSTNRLHNILVTLGTDALAIPCFFEQRRKVIEGAVSELAISVLHEIVSLVPRRNSRCSSPAAPPSIPVPGLFTEGAKEKRTVTIMIRRYLLENDLLETIVGLPTDMFYNTGISTYVWIVSNRKPKARKGKVQLIDASGFWQRTRKSLGSKRKELTDEHIAEITRIFGSFTEATEQRYRNQQIESLVSLIIR
jgi:hypothetical protein